MKYSASSFGDFRCAHCHNLVPSSHIVSGVNNRNHCPYCLWSFHFDLFAAGDRLSACKGQMKPIGLTMKRGRNKYRLESGGELMLIHQCIECGTLSINRLAADDHPDSVMDVFIQSLSLCHSLRDRCAREEITLLTRREMEIVSIQLFGHYEELPAFA
ncbi:MAG: RNHCP domain-containing protein [Chloroflexi bacterium]|nr:RNHCP domain-containing protein [Chloroflexota bacterium]